VASSNLYTYSPPCIPTHRPSVTQSPRSSGQFSAKGIACPVDKNSHNAFEVDSIGITQISFYSACSVFFLIYCILHRLTRREFDILYSMTVYFLVDLLAEETRNADAGNQRIAASAAPGVISSSRASHRVGHEDVCSAELPAFCEQPGNHHRFLGAAARRSAVSCSKRTATAEQG
jgi:hypothetical protein